MNNTFKKVCLDGDWQLYIAAHDDVADKNYATADEFLSTDILKIDAKVPGNFELDMQRAGLIDDPFFASNPLKLQELEDRHLWYVKKFDYKPTLETADKVFLFEGVDTFSEVYLNGELIGTTDNMMVEFEISAECLICGENELVVHIIPALVEARKHNNECYNYSKYRNESLYVRKAPHVYGWDIMPRAVSGGIWKSVYIVEKPKNRIDDFYILTGSMWENTASIRCYYSSTVSSAVKNDYAIRITGVCGESSFTYEEKFWHTSGQIGFSLENPKLWWPRDMGEQNLYDVKAELIYKGETVDTYEVKFGVRLVRLERTSLSGDDAKFCFYINEKPFFAKGTNWVPLDAFHSRDRERLPKALHLVDDIGCNIIRCWGGNVYESDEFYDFCDQKGIVIWQDFGMACGSYPQDDYFCDVLRREAEKVVRRLRCHASIILWAGDNECDESLSNPPFKRDPQKNRLTREVLPRVLYALDPIRPYLPSSPYMDEEAIKANRRRDTSEQHVWGPRDYFKGKYYRENMACFASETGYHGCNSPESIKKFISNDKVWPYDNEEWLVHAACMVPEERDPYAYRIPLMANQVKTLIGEIPETLEEFALASQISQAEAKKYFIERFRIGKGYRTGIIWWNLIDGWPQISDAVVDYYYQKKLAYHYIKNSQQAVCLMMTEPENATAKIVGANEFLRDVKIKYSVKALSTGEEIACGETTLAENATSHICTVAADPESKEIYLIEWETEDGVKGVNHYTCANIPYDINWYVGLMQKASFWKTEGFK